MISYEENETFALQTKYMLKKDWDIDCEIIYGYKIDNDKYTRTNVIMHGLVDFLLPKAIENGEDIYYIEDDVRFTKDPRDIPVDDFDVIWSGFRKGSLNNKRPVITGSQAIFMKKDIIKLVYDNFVKKKRKIQIDGGFSKVFKENQNIKFKQPKLSYCYEEEHVSLISLDDWSKYSKPT